MFLQFKPNSPFLLHSSVFFYFLKPLPFILTSSPFFSPISPLFSPFIVLFHSLKCFSILLSVTFLHSTYFPFSIPLFRFLSFPYTFSIPLPFMSFLFTYFTLIYSSPFSFNPLHLFPFPFPSLPFHLTIFLSRCSSTLCSQSPSPVFQIFRIIFFPLPPLYRSSLFSHSLSLPFTSIPLILLLPLNLLFFPYLSTSSATSTPSPFHLPPLPSRFSPCPVPFPSRLS